MIENESDGLSLEDLKEEDDLDVDDVALDDDLSVEEVTLEPVHTEPVHTEPVEVEAAGTEDRTELEVVEAPVAEPVITEPEVAETTDPVTGFEQFKLHPQIIAALTELGYEEPTPIQAEAIPLLLGGGDLVGQAATGTGKTAAFALPILEHLAQRPDAGQKGAAPAALVLVPTRELAMQVSEAIHKYGKHLRARVLPIYGGQPIGRQLQALSRGVDVVVATPGRALDHIKRRTLVLSDIKIAVLDEADEMLDMGFAEDLESILHEVPEERQTVLFSATMPPRINSIANKHLTDPLRIQIAKDSPNPETMPKIRQVAYMVRRNHKAAALGRILDMEAPEAAIVFCRTRIEVDQLAETLNGRGYRAEALHGGMSQEQRDRALGRLRSGTADLLLATDVAARGLDIDKLTHVVNYDVPSAPEAYVHRIGRVGRAGREGVAITLAEPREHRQLKNIERITKQKLKIDTVPTVEHLRERRMELTRAQLREIIIKSEGDHYRAVLESLADEFDVVEVALGAIQMAHQATSVESDDQEIPNVDLREHKQKSDRKGPFGRNRDREGGREGGRGFKRGDKRSTEGLTRIYVSSGKHNGMRPKDLVGAIAGESGLPGSKIGPIEIQDKFSLVSVPEADAETVIRSMKGVMIRGRKVNFRRERF